MSTFREILSRRNPDITSAWDGKSYGNTESSKKIYDEVIFDETYNSTIQECMNESKLRPHALVLIFISLPSSCSCGA